MMASTLTRILATLPAGARDVIVTCRKRPCITASIPDGTVPEHWAACGESAIQHLPGTRRVRWAGQIEETLW